MINRLIFISTLMFLTFVSCQDNTIVDSEDPDEMVPEPTHEKFDLSVLEIGSSTFTNFIMLCDGEGERLFDSIGVNPDFKISLDLEIGTVVNVTVGYINEDDFYFTSYLDVNSGAEIDLSEKWEIHPCFKSKKVKGNSRATLYVTDMSGYYETISSFSNLEQPEFRGDTLVLKGFALNKSNGDNQVAIRQAQNSELMSLIIPSQVWTWDNDTQSMEATVSFDDFSATNEHIIYVNKEDAWGVETMACDENGRLISLQNSPNNSFPWEEGQRIRVYINETVNWSELKLSLHGNYSPGRFSYNWIYNSMPDQIHLISDNDPVFSILENDHFRIESTYDYNVNMVDYDYPGYSAWRIVSNGGENINFEFPKLPTQFYSEFTYLESRLQEPRWGDSNMIMTEHPLQDITEVNAAMISINNAPDANFFLKNTSLRF